MTMSDRIAVMNHGRIEQLGAPEELYERSVDTFIARFVGDPEVSSALIRIANEKDTRRAVILLGSVLARPELADGLWSALGPHHAQAKRRPRRVTA